MFRSKTVFVIGAGASHELGLPTGDALKGKISSLLDIKYNNGSQYSGDWLVTASIQEYLRSSSEPHAYNRYISTCRDICRALPQAISIDNYIDAHDENERVSLIGKLGIARAILTSEQESRLYRSPQDLRDGGVYDPRKIEDTWHMQFMRILTEDVPRKSISSIFDNVSFVVFNYDRCLEYFLVNAISLYYSVPVESAQEIVRDARIVHPYGMVGKLEWQGDDGYNVGFGISDIEARDMLSVAKNLKTFTEQAGSEAVGQIREMISGAETIVFLGFAYYDQNMKILAAESKVSRIFGTAYQISKSDNEIVRSDIKNTFSVPSINVLETPDATCHNLFTLYRRSLSR